MKVVDPGHAYELREMDSDGTSQTLQFVKRNVVPGRNDAKPGIICQDVIEALIDRVKSLHEERPHHVNDQILHHLRMAFVLFEARAIERKVEKRQIHPENVRRSEHDGHFVFLTKP